MHSPACISRYASAAMHQPPVQHCFLSAKISDLVKGDFPRPLLPTMGMPPDVVVDFVVGTLLDLVHLGGVVGAYFPYTPQEWLGRLEFGAYDGRGSVGEFCGTFRHYRHRWCR